MSPRGLIHNNKGHGHGWTYVEGFWCHFIQNTTSLDLHNSMEHVIFYSVLELLRKQRPEKLLNCSKGRMWTQTSASRAGWHLWNLWALGNGRVTNEECHVIPGWLSKARYKNSQWKIKAWPNICTIIRCNKWRCCPAWPQVVCCREKWDPTKLPDNRSKVHYSWGLTYSCSWSYCTQIRSFLNGSGIGGSGWDMMYLIFQKLG